MVPTQGEKCRCLVRILWFSCVPIHHRSSPCHWFFLSGFLGGFFFTANLSLDLVPVAAVPPNRVLSSRFLFVSVVSWFMGIIIHSNRSSLLSALRPIIPARIDHGASPLTARNFQGTSRQSSQAAATLPVPALYYYFLFLGSHPLQGSTITTTTTSTTRTSTTTLDAILKRCQPVQPASPPTRPRSLSATGHRPPSFAPRPLQAATIDIDIGRYIFYHIFGPPAQPAGRIEHSRRTEHQSTDEQIVHFTRAATATTDPAPAVFASSRIHIGQ